MIERLVTLLAILAITVVTTVTSAHAARMSIGPGHDHAAHAGEMTPSPDVVEAGCEGDPRCGSADAGICDFVCAGLSALLASPDADPGPAHVSASRYFPRETSHVSRVPGLNERPPKARLL